MARIAGEPLIFHQLAWLRRAGVGEVVINLHHLGEQIEAAVGDGRNFGLRVRYSREEELLETGGGIRKALPLLRPGPFLLLNGDIWTNYPFRKLLATRPARAHLVLTPKPPHKPAADFHFVGEVADVAKGHQRVERDPVRDDLTYCGFAMLAEALFAHSEAAAHNEATPFSLRDLLFDAARQGTLTGERFDGAWIDIGTPQQLRRARRLA